MAHPDVILPHPEQSSQVQFYPEKVNPAMQPVQLLVSRQLEHYSGQGLQYVVLTVAL